MIENKLVEDMKIAILSKQHFVLETPLSHPDYWAYIDLFERNNYQVQLNYLCLDKARDCIARVEQRVIEGGHYVEPKTIKGVYEKNLEHINNYKDIFKMVELYDGMVFPKLLVRIEEGVVTFAIKEALKKKWITTGFSELVKEIKSFI